MSERHSFLACPTLLAVLKIAPRLCHAGEMAQLYQFTAWVLASLQKGDAQQSTVLITSHLVVHPVCGVVWVRGTWVRQSFFFRLSISVEPTRKSIVTFAVHRVNLECYQSLETESLQGSGA